MYLTLMRYFQDFIFLHLSYLHVLETVFYVRVNAINNLTNDVILRWSIEDNNGTLISTASPNFIIGGNDKQMISLKFEKLRPHSSSVRRIQFSAIDKSSQIELHVNSLKLFELNATGLELDPIDLVIKRPCK